MMELKEPALDNTFPRPTLSDGATVRSFVPMTYLVFDLGPQCARSVPLTWEPIDGARGRHGDRVLVALRPGDRPAPACQYRHTSPRTGRAPQ